MKKKNKMTNKFTSEEKESWWGKGEWCDESDLVEFEHFGLKCKVIRQATPEPDTKELHMFGGHLCGYVSIDKDHAYYEKNYSDLDLEAHGGITFGDFHDDGLYWIGFDCGHCMDVIPSMQFLKKKYNFFEGDSILDEIRKRHKDNPLFNPTYKNISYAIEECKSLAEQLDKLKSNDKQNN